MQKIILVEKNSTTFGLKAGCSAVQCRL